MTDIKIKVVSPGANERSIAFELTEKPTTNWKEHFGKFWGASLLSKKITHNFGNANKLTFDGNIGEPQDLVDELKKVLDSTNQVENNFADKIKNLKL
jgi:uncharacterized protein YcbX